MAMFRRIAGVFLAAALVAAVPASAAAAPAEDARPAAAVQVDQLPGAAATSGEGFRTGETVEGPALKRGEAPAKTAAWYYHITASCSGYAGSIRTGANFWGDGVETASSGTPVECTGGYVEGCGGSGNVVGCNWGQGQRIMLSTMVSDFALLAAHEFGHNWYGHSPAGCANWASAYEVMRPTMC